MSVLLHFGDPCVHCATPHDDVAPGPCQGDPSKAVAMTWRSLGVRWDNVEHYLIRMSNDVVIDRWEHIDMGLPYGYLRNARYDAALTRSR